MYTYSKSRNVFIPNYESTSIHKTTFNIIIELDSKIPKSLLDKIFNIVMPKNECLL